MGEVVGWVGEMVGGGMGGLGGGMVEVVGWARWWDGRERQNVVHMTCVESGRVKSCHQSPVANLPVGRLCTEVGAACHLLLYS